MKVQVHDEKGQIHRYIGVTEPFIAEAFRARGKQNDATMPGHGKVVQQLKDKGLKTMISVMIGGAPVTRRFAEEVGADGFAPNAVEAVSEARRLTGSA